MLITRAEIGGVSPLDVRIVDGRIVEIDRDLSRAAGELLLDAAGGALLPGLHDHHLHLFALAAASASVRCGPPEVPDRDALAQALASSGHAAEWIRGVGYHESVAGELDRRALDALVAERPVRIQQRSGALWMLNSAAIDRVGLDRGVDARGVERDEAGRATGRLFRLDEWLRKQLDAIAPPSLAQVSRRLASFGVTGITDATHSNAAAELRVFTAAAERNELLQRVLMLGSAELPQSNHPRIERGAVKLLLDERELPSFDEFQQRIEAAHEQQRAVAVHCVTRSELVLAIAAFAAAGTRAGDRIEHAAIAPPDTLKLVADLGLTVVTQHGFLRERGDAYLIDVETRDQPWLYRGRGFLEASVAVGGGTDAPFGDPDPWRSMQSAIDRRCEAGIMLGPDERLTPEQALALFTTDPASPGGAPRTLKAGVPADLCLLDRPWSRARAELSSDLVRCAIREGSLIGSPSPD